jgi:hypothetical protein
VRSFFYCAVITSALVAACDGGTSGPPNAGPPAALSVVSGSPQEGPVGSQLAAPLTVKVVDSNNRAVAGTVVTFSPSAGGGTVSSARDTTDAEGLASVNWTLGSLVGAMRVEARVSGINAAAVFNATARAGSAAGVQRVSSAPGTSAAGFELPDSVAVRVTDQFGNAVAGAAVEFSVQNGGGAVSPAAATTNAEGIARVNWVLGGVGPQSMRASSGTFQTTVDANAAACTQSTVAVGGVLTIGPGQPRCVVLDGAAQRYFVTVVNTNAAASSSNAFRVRGAGNGMPTTGGDVAIGITPTFGVHASARAMVDKTHNDIETHRRLMEANERVLAQRLPQFNATRASRMQNMSVLSAAAPPPNVGDTLNLRIPGNFADLCSTAGAPLVRARVVFVGTHGVMLEDVTNTTPVTGQLDTLYAKVGQEFDNTMWTILNANFGNPLAMDAQTDANQRFFMLFSRFVNEMQGGGIAGFVASSDFFPPSQCPASNQAEVFYARVPTTTATDYTNGSAKDWYRRTRTVMMHEVKHIVSFAERIARGQVRPAGYNESDRWLEESSAMLAEELWARTQYGYTAKTNVNYASSVGCEVRPNSTNPQYAACADKPLSMFDHFILLYDYQSNVENLTPIGAANPTDFTFYGSGWSFLRWVIDTYGASEGSFLTAMTTELVEPGVRNIEKQTARTFAELINDWSIAVALDDYPGFTPLDPKHQLVSWNSRDIFAGMSADFTDQGFFTRPVPMQIRPASFGKFAIDVGSVRGGSMAVFEVSGTQATQQMFEFNGVSGTNFPADMRVNIIRVQ